MTQSIVGEKSLAFAKRIANFPSKREQRTLRKAREEQACLLFRAKATSAKLKLAFYAEREESQRS